MPSHACFAAGFLEARCSGSCSLFCSRARVPSSCRSRRGPWRLAALRSRWATTRRRAPSLRLCLRARCVQRRRAAWESRRCCPYLRRPSVHDSLSHTPPPLAPGCAGREALQQDPRQGYRHPLAGTHLLHPALAPTLTPEPQPQRCSQPQTRRSNPSPALTPPTRRSSPTSARTSACRGRCVAPSSRRPRPRVACWASSTEGARTRLEPKVRL